MNEQYLQPIKDSNVARELQAKSAKKRSQNCKERKLIKQGLEEKLKNILSQIEGAGELDVMITYESSEEIQPAFNTNTNNYTMKVGYDVSELKISGIPSSTYKYQIKIVFYGRR